MTYHYHDCRNYTAVVKFVTVIVVVSHHGDDDHTVESKHSQQVSSACDASQSITSIAVYLDIVNISQCKHEVILIMQAFKLHMTSVLSQASDTHLPLHCETTAARCCNLNRHQHDHILDAPHMQAPLPCRV